MSIQKNNTNEALIGRGQGLAGSAICICTQCGYREKHTRSVPCSQKQCPKCGTYMKGTHC